MAEFTLNRFIAAARLLRSGWNHRHVPSEALYSNCFAEQSSNSAFTRPPDLD